MALKDDYLNWFPCSVTTGADSSVIASTNHNTNAGASEKIAWRVHKIEWFPTVNLSGIDDSNFEIVLSTRRGLTVTPGIVDMGTIGIMRYYEREGAAGYVVQTEPVVHDYLPPFVMAGANITMYYKGSVNVAAWQSKVIEARIGYTMVSIAGDIWQELFQTWNFSN
jgi:hypothetical protein